MINDDTIPIPITLIGFELCLPDSVVFFACNGRTWFKLDAEANMRCLVAGSNLVHALALYFHCFRGAKMSSGYLRMRRKNGFYTINAL